MDISLTGTTILLILLGIIALIVSVIFALRAYLRKQDPVELRRRHEEAEDLSPLSGRNKFTEVHVFDRFGIPILLGGIVLSFILVIVAMSWTQYDDDVYIPEGALTLDEEIIMEPPPMQEPPPPPPPPPPPKIEEVPEEEIEEDPPEFEDQSVEEETFIEPPPEPQEAPPPPPPPKPEPQVEEIFKVVEQMPRFPGCEDKATEAERKKCADEKMLQFIYSNIEYPAIAKENGIEGGVVVQFVVEKDGSITDIKVVRNQPGGLGEEAKRVVEMMNKKNIRWTPGKQRGRPVRVRFTLPVRFRLE